MRQASSMQAGAPEGEAGRVSELPGLVRLRHERLCAALRRRRSLAVGRKDGHVDLLRRTLESCKTTVDTVENAEMRSGQGSGAPTCVQPG